MQAETVGGLLDAVAAVWTIETDAEITLEANPGTIDAGLLARLGDAGVTRVSLGVQSFSPMLRAALGEHVGAYYVRLMVRDEPGVIADISAALRDERVSLEAVIQRSRSQEEAVPVVLTTHDTIEESMRRAMTRIGALQSVMEEPCVIRIEEMK